MLSIQVSTVLLAFYILGGNAEDSNGVTECSSRCSQMGGKCMTTGEECKGLDTISLNCADGTSCNCCIGEGKHEIKKRESSSENAKGNPNKSQKKKNKQNSRSGQKSKTPATGNGKLNGKLDKKNKKAGRKLKSGSKGNKNKGIKKKSRSGSKGKPRSGTGNKNPGKNKSKNKNRPTGRKIRKNPGDKEPPTKKEKKGRSGKGPKRTKKTKKKKGRSEKVNKPNKPNKKKGRPGKVNKPNKPNKNNGRKSKKGNRKNQMNGRNSKITGDDDNKNCDFKCKNGNCGKNKRKCDKIDDCGDNTDEQGCNFASQLTCHRCKTWDTGDVGAKYDTSCGNTGYDGTVDNADTLDPFVGCAIKVYNNGDVVRLFESWQYNATQGNCFTGADHDSKDPEYQYIRCWCKGNNCNTGLCEECGVDESKNNKH